MVPATNCSTRSNKNSVVCLFSPKTLGLITPDVVALRDRHDIPGMAVLQFAFGDTGAHAYLPHRLTPNRVIYSGTHDNDTTVGWWSTLGEKERAAVRALIGECEDGPNWGLIRLAQSSPANFSIVPFQDVTGFRQRSASQHSQHHRRKLSLALFAGIVPLRTRGKAVRACRGH